MSNTDKFILWIFFAIAEPFHLVSILLVYLFAFIHLATLHDIPKTKVSIREKPLAKATIRMAAAYFKHRRERLILFKQAAGELRDQLSIFQKISQIVAPQPIVNFMMNQRPELEAGPASVMNEREFEAVLKQVREYSTVKQILEGNSEKVIYNK